MQNGGMKTPVRVETLVFTVTGHVLLSRFAGSVALPYVVLPFEKLNPTFHMSTPRGGASVSCSATAL